MPVRYLLCLLVCEGPSDEWFLTELLRRAIDEICLGFERSLIEVVVEHVLVDHQRSADILERLKDERFDVLLYHHDGAPALPARAKIAEVCEAFTTVRTGPVVAVVPVRETEAWMLCDPAALAAILGVKPATVAEQLPERIRDLEGVPDPKRCLKTVRKAVTGPELGPAGPVRQHRRAPGPRPAAPGPLFRPLVGRHDGSSHHDGLQIMTDTTTTGAKR